MGLTAFGVFHTAISLVAVGSGAYALIKEKRIGWESTAGKVYILTTIATCLTGFGIFQHGGFGKPHILGVITLLVMALAFVWTNKRPIVSSVLYTSTFLFNLIPGFTETLTRLPVDHPYASSPEDDLVKGSIGVLFMLFIALAAFQIRNMRKQRMR